MCAHSLGRSENFGPGASREKEGEREREFTVAARIRRDRESANRRLDELQNAAMPRSRRGQRIPARCRKEGEAHFFVTALARKGRERWRSILLNKFREIKGNAHRHTYAAGNRKGRHRWRRMRDGCAPGTRERPRPLA